MFESKKRSFVKSLIWRIIATINGIVGTYFFIDNISQSIKIGIFANFTGMILYYIHERIWNKIKWEKNKL